MADLTYTTATVVIPPEDAWAAIQAIRQKHDNKFRRWMPHITLIYPFRSVDDFPMLHGPLAAAVARLPLFEVTLAEFKTFRHRRGYTIWLNPVPHEPLADLHEVLAVSGR